MNLFISSFKFKAALKAVLFFLILILLLSGLKSIRSGIISSTAKVKADSLTNQEKKLAGIVSNELDADISIFGSSVAWVHFDPNIISKKTNKAAYNFGLDATPLQQYKGVLMEFLTYSKAEIIVLAGSYSEFTKRDKIYFFDMYEPYLDNEFIYSSLSQISPDIKKVKYVPFYDIIFYQNQYRQILYGQYKEGAAAELTPGYYTNDELGFHPVNSKWMEQEWMKQGERSAKNAITINISKNVVDSYKEVISEINKRGIKVILVLTPVYIKGQEGVKNLNEIRAVYRNLAGEKNYFLDFTMHEICANKNLFYNYVHLNAQGAEILSEAFSKEILKLDLNHQILN